MITNQDENLQLQDGADDARYYELDHNREIFVDGELNDELLKTLTPQILALRRSSRAPITVAIDSFGGSLATVDALIGLIRGPMQVGPRGQMYTLVTNRAYSAAATLLAIGDYAVAFPHAEILFHDVRYDGLRDVTPTKARETAKALNALNEEYALRLARKVMPRLVWNYADLRSRIRDFRRVYPAYAQRFDSEFAGYETSAGLLGVDFPGFLLTIWGMLSSGSDQLVLDANLRLRRWIQNRKIAQTIPRNRAKGKRTPGLIDGAAHLYEKLRTQKGYTSGDTLLSDSHQDDLALFISLGVGRLAELNNSRAQMDDLLERVAADYAVSKSFEDSKHMVSIQSMIVRHTWTFFGRDIKEELSGKPESERLKILEPAIPTVRLFWFFCVFLCRTLFEGDHVLTPADAQLLGLIDEVCGGGSIQSRREFAMASAAAAS